MFPHIYLSWFSCKYSILVELEFKMLVQQPQLSIRKRIAIRILITAVLRTWVKGKGAGEEEVAHRVQGGSWVF